jgi:hypothetical protein
MVYELVYTPSVTMQERASTRALRLRIPCIAYNLTKVIPNYTILSTENGLVIHRLPLDGYNLNKRSPRHYRRGLHNLITKGYL